MGQTGSVPLITSKTYCHFLVAHLTTIYCPSQYPYSKTHYSHLQKAYYSFQIVAPHFIRLHLSIFPCDAAVPIQFKEDADVVSDSDFDAKPFPVKALYYGIVVIP